MPCDLRRQHALRQLAGLERDDAAARDARGVDDAVHGAEARLGAGEGVLHRARVAHVGLHDQDLGRRCLRASTARIRRLVGVAPGAVEPAAHASRGGRPARPTSTSRARTDSARCRASARPMPPRPPVIR